MMPERQKPSAGRDDREKQLSFTELGFYPPKASVGTLFSATFRAKGSGRFWDSQEHRAGAGRSWVSGQSISSQPDGPGCEAIPGWGS